MARLPRYTLPDQPQHIIQRGNNRQVIFAADEDYQFFRDALVEAVEKHGLAIHAYVWMTNHVHLLATPAYGDSIGKVFQSLGRCYVQHFNFTYKRTGTLWEGRYRATVVDSSHYLLSVMRYIELNPVRAGLVASPEDYAWSSYRRNGLGEEGANCDWISSHVEYLGLGLDPEERQAAYLCLFANALSEAVVNEIRGCTHKGWALGDERFRQEVESLGQRRAVSKGVGRPKRKISQESVLPGAVGAGSSAPCGYARD